MANYWKDHPAYIYSERLALVTHQTGKWELFVAKYKKSIDYQGGTFAEIYHNGEHVDSVDPDVVLYRHPGADTRRCSVDLLNDAIECYEEELAAAEV